MNVILNLYQREHSSERQPPVDAAHHGSATIFASEPSRHEEIYILSFLQNLNFMQK